MELTRAQSVNRYIEEEVYTETCQWAVFPHGTTVLLTPPAVVPQTLLALRARDVMRACGIERGSFDGIARINGGILVEFASKCDLPRGVKILGAFPTLHKISTRYAIKDMGLDPFVVNCNPGVYDTDSDETPCAGPGEYDGEESDDDEDVTRNPSDDVGVESERRFRSCDPRSTTVDARWVRDTE